MKTFPKLPATMTPPAEQIMDFNVVSPNIAWELFDAGMNQEITDISKSGESLVLAFVGEAQGQTFDAVITLEPTGPDAVDVYFDIAAGAFAMTGTGTKAAN